MARNFLSFGYTGEVTISVMKEKRILKQITTHNEGSMELFRIITSQLCGINENHNLPLYFDAIRVNSTSGLLNRMYLTSRKSEFFDGVPCAYFSVLIPANQFLRQQIPIVKFALYNNYSSAVDTFLAQVSLTQDQINELDNYISTDANTQKIYSTYNLLIEWRMFISNANVTRLETPVITKNGNTLSWIPVPNATGYVVRTIDESGVAADHEITNTTYTLDNNMQAQVQSISTSSGYIPSSWSSITTL